MTSRWHLDAVPTVYIMASGSHGTLYVGVTSEITKRIAQHRAGAFDSFTKRYGINRLVWIDTAPTMRDAIAHEKRLKRWLRPWKYDLIAEHNPTWRDLAEDFGFPPLPPKKVDPGSRPG